MLVLVVVLECVADVGQSTVLVDPKILVRTWAEGRKYVCTRASPDLVIPTTQTRQAQPNPRHTFRRVQVSDAVRGANSHCAQGPKSLSAHGAATSLTLVLGEAEGVEAVREGGRLAGLELDVGNVHAVIRRGAMWGVGMWVGVRRVRFA